jgi:hypothetical protein
LPPVAKKVAQTDSDQYFRNSGEVNKWLYDHFSMTMLLETTAFRQVSRKTYQTSDIPERNWFNMDLSNYGDHPVELSLTLKRESPDQHCCNSH